MTGREWRFVAQVTQSVCARLAGRERPRVRGRVASPAPGPGVTRARYCRSGLCHVASNNPMDNDSRLNKHCFFFQETSGCNCLPYEQCPTFLKVGICVVIMILFI